MVWCKCWRWLLCLAPALTAGCLQEEPAAELHSVASELAAVAVPRLAQAPGGATPRIPSVPRAGCGDGAAWTPVTGQSLRPEVASIVRELAGFRSVASATVGYAGRPSRAHSVYVRLVEEARSSELSLLLRHPCAVVRTYVALHIVASGRLSDPNLQGIFRDDTEVGTIGGCVISTTKVGTRIVGRVCALVGKGEPASSQAKAILERLATEGDLDHAKAARVCLEQRRRYQQHTRGRMPTEP